MPAFHQNRKETEAESTVSSVQTRRFTNGAQILLRQPLLNTIRVKIMPTLQRSNIFAHIIFLLQHTKSRVYKHETNLKRYYELMNMPLLDIYCKARSQWDRLFCCRPCISFASNGSLWFLHPTLCTHFRCAPPELTIPVNTSAFLHDISCFTKMYL